jgi:hypothetical protein
MIIDFMYRVVNKLQQARLDIAYGAFHLQNPFGYFGEIALYGQARNHL